MTGPRPRVRIAKLAEFSEFLAVMLDAGLPLSEALTQCTELFERDAVGALASRLDRALSSGSSLAQALHCDPATSSGLLLRAVIIGERSGNLALALRRTAAHLRRNDRVRQQLLGSLSYPLLLLVFLVAALILLQWILLPSLQQAIAPLGGGQQGPLAAIAATARAEAAAGVSLLFVGGAAILIALRWTGTSGGGRGFGRFSLSLPLLGRINRLSQYNLFVSALESLAGSGASIEEAIQEASILLTNPVLRAAVSRATEQIKGGTSVSRALRRERWIPRRIVNTLSVAERTGNAGELLRPLRTIYEWEYEHSLRRLATLAEPAFLIATGIGIVVVVSTVVLPLLSVVTAAGG